MNSMRFPIQNHIFFLLLLHVPLCFSDHRTSQAGLFCGPSSQPPRTNFIPIFVKEMQALSQLLISTTTANHFATHSLTSTATATPVYALAQCFRHLSHTDCILCYAASRTKLPRCLPSLSARIFFDGCFLRYDTYNFYNESVDFKHDAVVCNNSSNSDASQTKLEFLTKIGYAVGNVTSVAVRNGGFGVAQAGGVYALAQCWESVGSEGCRKCLEKAAKGVKGCAPKGEGRGLNAGCYLRYSTEKFYNDQGETRDYHGFPATGVIVAVVLSVAAFLMLCLSAAYASYARLSKAKEGRYNLGQATTSLNKSTLSFKYEVLEKATDYFNPARKIGQGGAGSVYMGTLHNGKTVAVKRLIFNTRQWVDEFFNEVNLISGVQHKNLVKLLGCSIEGPESLLVYEYVPNRSLDQIIFDKNKIHILKWKQRFDIIVGTAEGLAYLHGGSKVRIIHRDIKSSNILLDENLTPKIADFGLARCFAADKTHLSTGIAGTLGYMAPEYLVRGQLTEKADVYSFGVLALEIVCGRNNTTFIQDSGSLLQIVWKLYKSDRLAEAVDPCLRDEFPAEQASDVLQIGLLCTQASVTARPSMTQVVFMLTNKDCEIPIPNQPPFLNANVLEATNSVRSYSESSLVSNAAAQVEVPTSTDCSSIHSSDKPSGRGDLMEK